MATGRNTSNTSYTKVTIKKSVAEQGKIQAAAENRTLANYVEHLILSAGSEPQNKEGSHVQIHSPSIQ